MRHLALLLLLSLALAGLAQATGERVRPAANAGSWYPGDAAELGEYLDGLLGEPAAATAGDPIRALISPHAGYTYSGATAARLYARLRGRSYERVIVLGPSHRGGFHGLSIAEVETYATPLGSIPLDLEAIERLRADPLVVSDPDAHAREHSVELQLPMLQRALAPGWRLLPILVGQMRDTEYARAAELLRPLADERTLVVVSSDFTHYGPGFGYLPFPLDAELPANLEGLDRGAYAEIERGDPNGFLEYYRRTGITVCGFGPITILLHLMGPPFATELVEYQTSGRLLGEWQQSVSYLAIAVTAPRPFAALPSGPVPATEGPLTEMELRLLHRLAVLGVRYATNPQGVTQDQVDSVVQLFPQRLHDQAGAFVTLKRNGELRGCVGYIEPIKPLSIAVFENGINAAVRDHRFPPVQADELPGLTLEVSVLTRPREITTLDEFELGHHGIVLNKEGRRAVFLPEVPSGEGWDKDETLRHLAEKAGLPADGWREGASFEVFETLIHEAPLRP